MDLRKIFILLIALIVYINYTNYLQEDSKKLYRTIDTLKMKIEQEKEIQKKHLKKEDLTINTDKLMLNGIKLSYSQAMGKLQDIITKSAKDICTVKKIKWAQTTSTALWYDRLRMNLVLECSPKNFYIFTNSLKSNGKLFQINSLRIMKMRNKEQLYISMQLMAYRKHK